MSHKFEKLNCWKNSIKLADSVYKLTDEYPKNELYSLSNQTNRAAVSIGANIAEGCSRQSVKDFVHFINISIGSAYELITLLLIAHKRRYMSDYQKVKALEDLDIIIKQLYGLKRKLNEN